MSHAISSSVSVTSSVDSKEPFSHAHGAAVKIQVVERAGLFRSQEPVTVGVPLPKGMCSRPELLRLATPQGVLCSLQRKVLARWSDGSIKWVLLDFQADAAAFETVSYRLSSGPESADMPVDSGVSISRQNRGVSVRTGIAEFHLSDSVFRPFERVVLGGEEIAGPQESGLVVVDESGKEYLPHIEEVEIETAGFLRSTIRMIGAVRASDGVVLSHFTARLTFFARRSDVHIDWTIRNSRAAVHSRGLWDLGDPHSISIRECGMWVGLSSSEIEGIDWQIARDRPVEHRPATSIEVYQDSSGGDNWDSSNHVSSRGAITTSFRGYRLTIDGSLVEEGQRATPTLRVRSRSYGVSATIRGFWENFPKAMEVREGRLRAGLFPRQGKHVVEIQPGEQKTHTIFLRWDRADAPLTSPWVHDPLVATVSPEWYAATQAIPHLAPASEARMGLESEQMAERLILTAVEGNNTFFDRREVIDEYGWRNFGDLYADHEAVAWKGKKPLVAHYNNQYDVIYGALVQYARTGTMQWYDLVRDLARHVIDIDLYHTQEDRLALNGGLFWHTDHYTDAGTATHRSFSITSPQAQSSPSYGGGPACEHNYAAGLLLYYYLTGDVAAQEAVASLGDWVINMDDGSKRTLGWLDRRPTGYCSVTATQGYHGPGRGSGNSISVLLDAWLATGRLQYLEKAEALIRRCIHPHDDIRQRGFEDIEYRWSYTVFLQVLGKYLDLKAECGQLDRMYAYARASLLHYADWMAEHEVPYKTVLDRVLIPTETWPAQDVRKANVFCLAAKHAPAEQRDRLRAKAEMFFRACVSDLVAFETHALTRPLVLLLTNAYVYSYYHRHPSECAPPPAQSYEFGKPKAFKPQFHEVYVLRDIVKQGMRFLKSCVSVAAGLVAGRVSQPGGGHA